MRFGKKTYYRDNLPVLLVFPDEAPLFPPETYRPILIAHKVGDALRWWQREGDDAPPTSTYILPGEQRRCPVLNASLLVRPMTVAWAARWESKQFRQPWPWQR